MPFETIRSPAAVQTERYHEARSPRDLAVRRPALVELFRSHRKSDMTTRKRDYRKEYARRVTLATQKGLSRSAARGHPRAGERRKPLSAKTVDPHSREEQALRMMRRGSSLRDASNHYRMSQERLRAYIKEATGATRENGRWKIVDHRSRQFPFYSDSEVAKPWMSLDQASDAGRYMQAVKQFLRTGDTKILEPFAGKGVRDVNGKFYPFELNENTLYELDHRDEAVIPEQYRISERIAS